MRAIAILVLIFISLTVYAEEPFDVIAAGDHSVWVITNDVKDMFERETGSAMKLIPELAIVGKGCEKGVNLARQGRPDRDAGMVCCLLNTETLQDDLRVYQFAREPLAILVNRANPVDGLTSDQVRKIFSGKIDNWKDMGGADERIIVVTQLHCKQHDNNWKMILPDAESFTKDRINIKAQPEMVRTVADFSHAIGHLEMSSVMEAEADVKILSVDGYFPTSENMAKGLYPFYGHLAIVTKGEASGKARTFIDFMRNSAGVRAAMEKYGMAQVQ